jgi:hypothetical protein
MKYEKGVNVFIVHPSSLIPALNIVLIPDSPDRYDASCHAEKKSDERKDKR